MGIISVYIVNKAGGLIFSHDQPSASAEVEATFHYPLGLVLEEVDRNIVFKFGEKHGIQGTSCHMCQEIVSYVLLLVRQEVGQIVVRALPGPVLSIRVCMRVHLPILQQSGYWTGRK